MNKSHKEKTTLSQQLVVQQILQFIIEIMVCMAHQTMLQLQDWASGTYNGIST